MGLLDWFKRRRRRLPIHVYLDEGSRASAQRAAIGGHLARPGHVLLVAHFEEALVTAGRDLASVDIPCTTKGRWGAADMRQLLANREPTVIALLARTLPDIAAGEPRVEAAGSLPIAVFVTDLHVLAAANERLARFANALPEDSRAQVTISLDHPVFGTRLWVKTMMQKMGLMPGERIDSPRLDRTVARALRKLESRATGDAPCSSIETWLQRNVRM